MICESCIHNAVCKYGEARSNGLYCTGEKCKQYQSNADVVPKSEVEQLKEDNDRLKDDNDYLQDKVFKVRLEVAREIFEEIETCMKDFEDDDDGYLLKKCEFEFFMREIKEKYAEQKND